MITRSKTRKGQRENESSAPQKQPQSDVCGSEVPRKGDQISSRENFNSTLDMRSTEKRGAEESYAVAVPQGHQQLKERAPESVLKCSTKTAQIVGLELLTESDTKEDRSEAKQNGQKLKLDRKDSAAPETTHRTVDKNTPDSDSLDTRNEVQRGPLQKTLAASTSNSVCADGEQNKQRASLGSTPLIMAARLQEDNNLFVRKVDGNNSPPSSASNLSVKGRVSQAYLQSTRARRRAIAKARTERRESLKVEDLEKHGVKDLEGMNSAEKERFLKP